MTDKLGNNTSTGDSTKKIHGRKSWFSGEKEKRKVAAKVISSAIKDLNSKETKIRRDAALFIAGKDYHYWCERCGIDRKRLKLALKEIVSQPVGARRRRLTGDLLEELQEDS